MDEKQEGIYDDCNWKNKSKMYQINDGSWINAAHIMLSDSIMKQQRDLMFHDFLELGQVDIDFHAAQAREKLLKKQMSSIWHGNQEGPAKKYDLSALTDYANSPPLDKTILCCIELLGALDVQYMMGSIDEEEYEKDSSVLLDKIFNRRPFPYDAKLTVNDKPAVILEDGVTIQHLSPMMQLAISATEIHFKKPYKEVLRDIDNHVREVFQQKGEMVIKYADELASHPVPPSECFKKTTPFEDWQEGLEWGEQGDIIQP